MRKLLVIALLTFTMSAQAQEYFYEEYNTLIHGPTIEESIEEESLVTVEFNVDYSTNIVVHLKGDLYTFKRLTEPTIEYDKDGDKYVSFDLRDVQDGQRYMLRFYPEFMFLLSQNYKLLLLK